MASIQTRVRKDGTKTYRVAWREDGRLRYTPTLANPSGAEKIRAIIEDPRRGPKIALALLGQDTTPGRVTLAQYFPRYLRARALRCTPGTLAGYQREAEQRIFPRLGDIPLSQLDRDLISDWVLWLTAQPTARSLARAARHDPTAGKPAPPIETLAPKTVKNAHSLLSAVLELAVREGVIPTNHARGVDMPREQVPGEKEIFTRAEWARFYQAMTPHYRPFVLVMLATGARWGELTALQVQDVDLAAGAVHIRRAFKKAEKGTVLGAPKSSRSVRTILVPEWAVEALRPRVAGHEADRFVFTSPRGRVLHRTNFVERHWKKALREAGIAKPLTPHSLRHTFASWALAAGVPPLVVQHRLGHQSLQTTSTVYAHLLLEEQRSAVDALTLPAPIEA